MNRSVSVGVVVLVAVVLVAGLGVSTTMADVGTAGAAPSQSDAQLEVGTAQSTADPAANGQLQSPTGAESIRTTQEFDQTTFEITVHENGSATWTFRHEQWFSGDNESDDREAFEEFADEFESEETGLYERFTEQATAMTESGSELTGREMTATDFERSASVEGQFGAGTTGDVRGVVEMSFRWEGFATVDDGTVVVGDVFQDVYLGPDQAILIEADDGLTFDHVEPSDDAQPQRDSLRESRSVRWSGEHQFLDGQPHAVLHQEGAGGDGSDSPVSAVANGDSAWPLVVGALVVLAAAGGVVWYRRYGPGTATGAGDGAESPSRSADGTASTAGSSGAAAAGADGESTSESESDSGASNADPLPEEELLTDEDRVVRLIRENGGRMKQVNIVEETGWSKSKVSMLLSDMEDEGTISKLRVGRENIISLEGFEPEATKSPFEE